MGLLGKGHVFDITPDFQIHPLSLSGRCGPPASMEIGIMLVLDNIPFCMSWYHIWKRSVSKISNEIDILYSAGNAHESSVS